MIDESIYKIVKLPEESLKTLIPFSIFLKEPETDRYTNDDEKVGERKVSSKLLLDILSHEDSFNYVLKLFNEEISSLHIYFVSSEGEYRAQFSFGKKEFIEYIEKIIFSLTPELLDKFYKLTGMISFESLKEQKKDDIYTLEIEGNQYNFKVIDLLTFLELDDQEYLAYMSHENCTYKDVPITHFLYALKTYIHDNNIDRKFILREPIQKRLNEIEESKYIDIDAINKIREISDFNFNDIKVNEELRELILRDMPPYLTNLEKAIYIYIKMCKVLTYDEEFYAVNQRGPVADRHEEVSNVQKITPKNNRVVCYEFNAIYEKLIAELGIKFDTNQMLINGFGGGHANLTFREGKFLVKADSVTSILQGDLVQAKLNQRLSGLVCKNQNRNTQIEFQQAFERVYCLIAEQEKKLTENDVGREETFAEILAQYSRTTDSLQPVSLEEKMNILIAKINSTQMQGIDAFSYLLQLRKVLFTNQEQKDNIKISIIRNSNENSAEALSIISIRLPDETGKKVVNSYMFKPGSELIPISKEDLQANFDSETMGYVEADDPVIPGIKR